MRTLTALALAALTLALAACGDDTATPVSSPQTVAVQYTATAFACGKDGAGRAYDLSWSPERDWSRKQSIDYELRHGCARRPLPRLYVIDSQVREPCPTDALLPVNDIVWVIVYPGDPATTPHLRGLLLRVEWLHGTWKINTLCSGDPSDLATSPVAST